MNFGIKLKGKHILLVGSVSDLQPTAVSDLVDALLSQDCHLTFICPQPQLTTKHARLIEMGVFGHLDRQAMDIKTINTGDYHLVILIDKLDFQDLKPNCDFSRTWLSVLNCNELSDIPIEILQSDSDDDSTATRHELQMANIDERLISKQVDELLPSEQVDDIVNEDTIDNTSIIRRKPKLYIVGAGLGSPELITVKAQKLLQTVKVIITDRLVSPELLNTIPKSTRILFSRKVCGKANEAQNEINGWILEHLEQGMDVLRLKGGDPFVFGRGGEEWNLVIDKFQVEWVPGISSSIAAAGAAGIPVTHRGVADSFVVCTGTLMNPLNWSRIPEFDPKRTLILLMATRNFSLVVDKLINENKYPPSMPVAIVYKATLSDQKTLISTLGESSFLLEDSEIRNHSTIIVGDVVNCLNKPN